MIEIIVALWTAASVEAAAPNLPPEKTFQYAETIAKESLKFNIDPQVVVAVIWHESNFRNLPVNETEDRGLMQVHWYPGSPWLKGLKPDDLMRPRVNIRAGVHELAYWKKYHEENCSNSHQWFAHYKWGYKVKNHKYGISIRNKAILLSYKW